MHPLIQLLRPFTLLPPMLGMATGAAAAVGVVGWEVLDGSHARNILLGMVMAGTLNGASNVLNQIHDLEQDRINKPRRPLPAGTVSQSAARLFSVLLYVAALVMAWFVRVGAGPECFVLVVVAAFLTWAYSAPPLRWRRLGWRANLTVALPRGWLLKVAGWSTVAPVFHDLEPWFLGFVFFVFLLGATSTKDYADLAGDARAGVRNLPIKLGVERSIRVIAPFLIIPWLLLPLGCLGEHPILTPPWPAVTGLALVLAGYGAFIARLLLRDPRALQVHGENHPAWRHMYGLMMTAQIGSAVIYLVT